MDTKQKSQDAGIDVSFQDMDFHQGHELVTGPSLGKDNTKVYRKLEHPNQADVALQRIVDANGQS